MEGKLKSSATRRKRMFRKKIDFCVRTFGIRGVLVINLWEFGGRGALRVIHSCSLFLFQPPNKPHSIVFIFSTFMGFGTPTVCQIWELIPGSFFSPGRLVVQSTIDFIYFVYHGCLMLVVHRFPGLLFPVPSELCISRLIIQLGPRNL